MITECPECQTTFRVTAQALRQAHGRVRCGSCGTAFNALDHLSEEPAATDLSDTQTAQIFEEESRALLESLDDLAGDDDIRIEDTGAEWRVVDDESAEEPADEGAAGGADPASDMARATAADGAGSEQAMEGTGSTRWTFVDASQDDGAGAPDDDGAEALDGNAEAAAPPQAALDLGQASAGEAELRFDDNTPLPDEYFRPVTGAAAAAATPRRRASDRQEFSVSQPAGDSPQVDLELDGDDWQELLAEVEGDDALTPAAAEEPDDAREGADDRADLAAARQDASETVAAALEVAADTAADGAGDDETVEAAGDWLEGAGTAGLRDDDSGTEDEIGLAHGDEPEHAVDDEAAALASALAAAGGDAEADADVEIDRELLQAAASGDITTEAADSRYRLWDEDPSLVETIVMEGDTITDTLSEAGTDEPDEQPPAADADAGLDLAGTGFAAGAAERPAAMTPRQRYLGIAAIVLLGLLLAGQLVHANRESLATLGVFERTLAPLYAALGAPVTPAWNVRGWQFESTSGSTDESGSRLTIYSRIANRAAESLPYPLVHVSLTDRFDDVIGSRLLAPGEYLAGNGSLDRPVAAGDDFTAVITVDAPSPDATGFKLNVCYPVAGRRVRCAIEDFRD